MPRDDDSLLDIATSARQIQEYLVGVDRDMLEADLMRLDAVVRRLEIMGEATKRLSGEFKASQPEIPWQKMAGMRDLLIHAYNQVDLDEVWLTVARDVPELLRRLGPLLPPTQDT